MKSVNLSVRLLLALGIVMAFVITPAFFGATQSANADGLIVIIDPHHHHPIPRPPIHPPHHHPRPRPIPPRVYRFAPMQVVFHHVTITIKDQVAITEVDQEFYNPNNARLEGHYIFPLPKGAAIDKFSMDINGKQQQAELLDADKARKIYTDIVRKMKDSDGHYIWQPGLQAGQPAMILGYPTTEAEDMPDVAANAFPIAFGDFGEGYVVVERQGIRTLRDPFSAKPFVQFYTTKRVGGDVTNFDAIKLFKIAAS